MHVPPRVFETAADAGHAAAMCIQDRMTRKPRHPFLLGCPGGRSLATTYAAFARLAREADVDLSDLVVVMMDDYVVGDGHGNLTRVGANLPYSCEKYGREIIVDALNAAVSPSHRLSDDALWVPDPGDPEAYDDKIQGAGGIDLFLLASGASDGHIAFNPPDSDRRSRTRVVHLAESTRRDNLTTFPTFRGDLSQVPVLGVTVGIETISTLSASVLMVCHGADKGATIARIMSANGYDEGWPATILTECNDPQFFIDQAASDAARSYQTNSLRQ